MALSFVQEGCRRIVIADRDSTGLAGTARSIRELGRKDVPEVLTVAVDVVKEQEVSSMVDYAVKKFGRIDYAVNAAGKYLLSSFGSPAFIRT